MCTHNLCFEQNIKNINIVPKKFSIFISEKKISVHGQVFVMRKHNIPVHVKSHQVKDKFRVNRIQGNC